MIDNKSAINFLGSIKNNYLSTDLNIINNKTQIDLILNGNIKKGVYKINSKVNNIDYNDILNSSNPSIISFDNEINIKFLESLDFEADMTFADIEIKNSDDEIFLKKNYIYITTYYLNLIG